MADATDQNTVTLTVSGQQYYGWQSVSVSRSIEAVSGTYSLNVQDRWDGQPVRWPIKPGDQAAVSIGSDQLIAGYVDKVSPSYDGSSHSISIEGRDFSADLVDCAAYAPPGSWGSVDFMTVVGAIAKTYGVSVKLDPSANVSVPLPGFVIQNGETAWCAIERAAKREGVLALPDGKGGILIASPGTTRCNTALEHGVNIKAASAEYDYKERFGSYMIFSQSQGTDEAWGPQAGQVLAKAADAIFGSRTRLMIEIDPGLTTALAQRKVNWLAAVKAARSSPVKVTVQGFRQGNGDLWAFNKIVSLTSPPLGYDRATDLLIRGVTYSEDDSGSITTLDLVRPDAFIPEPFIPETETWNEINKGGA